MLHDFADDLDSQRRDVEDLNDNREMTYNALFARPLLLFVVVGGLTKTSLLSALAVVRHHVRAARSAPSRTLPRSSSLRREARNVLFDCVLIFDAVWDGCVLWVCLSISESLSVSHLGDDVSRRYCVATPAQLDQLYAALLDFRIEVVLGIVTSTGNKAIRRGVVDAYAQEQMKLSWILFVEQMMKLSWIALDELISVHLCFSPHILANASAAFEKH